LTKLAYTPDLNTETHDAYVMRLKGHDTIRVWVDRGDLSISVSDLEGTERKLTNGKATTKATSDGGVRVSSDSVRSYIFPRDAMMVARVFTGIDFTQDGPNVKKEAPMYLPSEWDDDEGVDEFDDEEDED